ncbi:MAG TPA: hypothetical protein VG994_02660 [Steroidobacteraceae bacterium]|nr:hypothetical protein [Steroidobacteraceae bacterium]
MRSDNRCSWGGCDQPADVIHRTIYPRGFDGGKPYEIRPRAYCAACAELNRQWAADITRMSRAGESHNGRLLQPVTVIEIPILRPGVGDNDVAIELFAHSLARIATPLTAVELAYLEAA